MRIPFISAMLFWIATWARRAYRSFENPVYRLARGRPFVRTAVLTTSVVASLVTLALGKNTNALILAYVSVLLSWIHERVTYLEHRDKLLDRLRRFGKAIETHHSYGRYLVLYKIDDSPGGLDDKWIREFEIVALDDSSVVVVRRFFVGADQDAEKLTWQFADLQVTAESDSAAAYVFESKYEPKFGRWEAELLFAPPLAGKDTPHLVNVQGRWPNLWKDLRLTGRDSGGFHLAEPARTLEISIVFPKKWEDRDLCLQPMKYTASKDVREPIEPFDPVNAIIDIRRTIDERRLQITWKIENALPGWYDYEVRALERRPEDASTPSEKDMSSSQ